MRIAHLADLHLGYRQYQRLNRNGINQREADVAQAFTRAVDGIMDAAPDLVIIAGDIFHSVRPTNPAILHAFNQFRRLKECVSNPAVILLAGNHDTPRSVETGSILRLFESFERFEVVISEARRVEFPTHETSVLCVPHAALVADDRPAFAPDADFRHNVLVTHGEVAGVIPGDDVREFGGAVIEPEDLQLARWSYVALGHYHVSHPVAPNIWFSGSLEYVSTNPWGEMKHEEASGRGGKGWLWVELGRKTKVEFHRVELARKYIDLPVVWGGGMSPEELDQVISERVAEADGGIDGNVVRLLIRDVPRPIARDINHKLIREYKTRALNFNLDLRRPQISRAVGVGSPGVRKTIPETVLEYLERRPLDASIDRRRLLDLAREHLGVLEEDSMQEEPVEELL